MKLLAVIVLSMSLLVVSINAEDNATSTTNTTSDYEVNAGEASKKAVTDLSESIIEGIKEIQSLKKDTFESTEEFVKRRNKKVSELNNKMIASAKKASSDYRAGTTTMKKYDADKEQITLALVWDKDLGQLLPEIKKQKIISIKIPRNEAKKLFSKENTHFAHIKLFYVDSKLALAEITLHNKYQLYIHPVLKKPEPLERKKNPEADEDNSSWSLWTWTAAILSIIVFSAFVVFLWFWLAEKYTKWKKKYE